MKTYASPGAPLRTTCFAVTDRAPVDDGGVESSPTLDHRSGDALATLLPLLGCGEEAAALAFDALANRYFKDNSITIALAVIAQEERVHDSLIDGLRRTLPPAIVDSSALEDTRRFHIAMARGGPRFHLARIAALDSSVCLLLGRLLRNGTPIGSCPVVSPVVRRIRADEARHVRVSRRLALDRGAGLAMRDAAAAARDALADILAHVADAFEDLGVDPQSLDRDIRRLPDGLLTA